MILQRLRTVVTHAGYRARGVTDLFARARIDIRGVPRTQSSP